MRDPFEYASKLEDEDLPRILTEHLKERWVLLSGSPERLLAWIEWEAFTPGTKANDDFKVFLTINKRRGARIIGMCRKTPELKRLVMRHAGDMSPSFREEMFPRIMIIFEKPNQVSKIEGPALQMFGFTEKAEKEIGMEKLIPDAVQTYLHVLDPETW